LRCINRLFSVKIINIMQVDFANIPVDNVTLKESLDKLDELIASQGPHLVVTPNPEMIVAAQEDNLLKQIIKSAALRLPDGISLVVVSRILRRPLKERVAGIEFMLQAVRMASLKHYRIYLLGGKPGIAQKAAESLKNSFPSLLIVGVHDGYFEHDGTIINQIKAAQPDLLFAGLGAGRQEKWLAKYLKVLGVPVCVGVGGSMDVISGYKKRAPKIFRRLYIEWLYRLVTEPWRWKRQLALPKFLWLVFTKGLKG